ncbi:MAG: hypothetical protein RBT69_07230, partial [Spirochaetia bacterium]|nr:hypothetical protein [Spirochaetia bacterium]
MAAVFFMLIFFAVCSGCSGTYGTSGIDKYELEAVLPELPPHLRGTAEPGYGICFRLDYPGISPLEGSLFYRPGDYAVIYSDLPVLPVVASAYTISGIPLYPAGGIYPEDFCKGKLLTGWEDGLAASIVSSLIKNGISLENFNIGRFERVLLEKSDGNPWLLSEDEIVYGLSFGIFNSNFIKKKEVHNLSLAVSGDDPDNRWFLSNLLENRIFTSLDSYLTAGLLPERNVILISTMCGARYIEVFMDS